MDKPQKRTKVFYDYHDCKSFLQKKYNFNERDVAGRFFPATNPAAPYQDFWHFIISCAEVRNESFFKMDNEWLEFAEEEWQRKIVEYYLSEFGEGEDRAVTFWVEW